ncbi:MAG: TetR/AcrR family transcriptional regulator [Candidatus Dormibacteraeota bacterium]|nr:TetR/AcrR family transcriptional regulator [Candidatus Dormibacteraeota bacterium]
MTPVAPTERISAEERKEQILRVAIGVFAEDGYSAGSTEEIARRAGISQPYIFRLFGTKQQLFLDAIDRCFEDTAAVFRKAAEGKAGESALRAIGEAYMQMIERDHVRLRAQLQAYAACEDRQVRQLVSRNFGRLVKLVQDLSGVDRVALAAFFSTGMLLNVLSVMGQFREPQAWAIQLMEGCAGEMGAQEKFASLGL